MGGTPTIPPPPASANQPLPKPTDSAGNTDMYDMSGRNRMLGLVNRLTGGGLPQVAQTIQEEHTRRMNDMDNFRQQMATYSQQMASGRDANGKPIHDAQGNLTPEGLYLQHQYEVAEKNYLERAKISTNAKSIAEKTFDFAKNVIHHHVANGGAQPAGGGAAAGAAAPTIAPPPAAGAAPAPAAAGPAAVPAPVVPPPPSGQSKAGQNPTSASASNGAAPRPSASAPATPPTLPAPPSASASAPAATAPTAASSTPAATSAAPASTTAPATAPALPPPPQAGGGQIPPLMSAMGAPQLQKQLDISNAVAQQHALGEETLGHEKAAELQKADIAREEIERLYGTDISPEYKKQLIARKLGFIPPIKMVTKVVADPQSPTGASDVSYDSITGQVYTTRPGAFMPRGYIPSETLTKDQFGNMTVSTRTPIAPGVNAPPANAAPAAKPSKLPRAGSSPALPAPPGKAGAAAGVAAVDEDGHIPVGTATGYPPQTVDNANKLLDGMAIKDLPSKAQGPASELARKFGWAQGKFTPKEQTLLREAATYLQQAVQSPALAALDEGTMSRVPMIGASATPDKEGFFGKLFSAAAAGQMDPQQAEFMRMYNQLVGTISGLSQLVRGGRATEAQIDRLKAELPNPTNTQSAADAKARLTRLLNEITVAMEKGEFRGLGGGALPAPPSEGTAPKVIKWGRDTKGNPVPLGQ